MRAKYTVQETFNYHPISSVKVVQEYVNKYKGIDMILQSNRDLLDEVHDDFSKYLSDSSKGRTAAYTTEQIFRALMVMFIEQWSYRKTVVNIDSNMVLQKFVGLGFKPMMDYTFLSKAYCALSEETWEKINQSLSRYAKEEKELDSDYLRMDSTAYEANIHYPTDSSLLWDSYRTLARLMKSIRLEMLSVGLDHRFHKRKVKKLSFFINRNGGSKSKSKIRKVKSTYRILIDRVRKIEGIAKQAVQALDGQLLGEIEELKHYLPIVKKIINQATKRVIEGEQLPSSDKIYSLFEEHTELLIRGKAGKPIEFGHKILIAQNKDKFITHYDVMRKRKDDTELLDEALMAHETLFEKSPKVLATDKGFYKSKEQLKTLSKKIKTVSICKKGSRTAEEKERESTAEFKDGQKFRAGSEGSISVLKRAYKLKRCLFKGYKNFAVSVGCAVFCHNLVLLTQL